MRSHSSVSSPEPPRSAYNELRSPSSLSLLTELEELIDSAVDAMIIRDEEGRILLWNKSAENILGWKKEEVLGKQAQQILNTQCTEGLDSIYKALSQSGKWIGELTHFAKDQTPVLMESNWSLKTKTDEPAKILEITKALPSHRLSEAQLRKLNKALETRISESLVELRENKARFTAAEEGAGVGVWDWFPPSTSTYFSPHWKSMLGYSEYELKNSTEEFSNLIHPRRPETHLGHRETCAVGKLHPLRMRISSST